MNIKEITFEIIGCAYKVHTELGPGLLESAYEECLSYMLIKKGLKIYRQKAIPIYFEDVKLECGYRIDILVEDCIVIELKSVDEIHPVHTAQILTYMKFSNKKLGLLLNFNVVSMKNGIKRFIL